MEKKEKRYWWLKLQENFFQQGEIKALRRKPNGETLIIIYLKMQLFSLKNSGVIYFEGFEESFVEELAYQIDEDSKEVDRTITFLKKHGLLLELSPTENQLPKVIECIGSEGSSAKRVREHRERQKALQSNIDLLQCNDLALLCHGEKEKSNNYIKEEKENTPLTPQGETCDGTVYSKDFENVWNLYPRKADKLKAFKAWNKINPSEELTNKILNAIIHTKATEQWQKEGGRFIPHLANWLSNRRWEDEPEKKYNASCDLDQYKRQDIFNNTYSNLKNNPDIKREELPPGINSQEELEALKARLRE